MTTRKETNGLKVEASMEFTMVDKMKRTVEEKNAFMELDAQLWEDLPEEILEMVITKLPFSRVVAFRAVCKKWHSEVIPRIASSIQASSGSSLLYFGCSYWNPLVDMESKGSMWWLEVCNSKGTGGVKEFKPRSFPVARTGEDVLLMNSQGGILFFAFMRRTTRVVREIVACNPLISKSKCLGLPYPLVSPLGQDLHLLVGVACDTKMGTYVLVAAGVDSTGAHVTLLYDSSTSAWTSGPSLLPTLLGSFAEGGSYLMFEPRRSVLCNGNLYWNTRSLAQGPYYQCVIKFDIQRGMWRSSLVNLHRQMALHDGEIVLWHLRKSPVNIAANEGNRIGYTIEELCYLDEFLSTQLKHGRRCKEYIAVSHENFIYHVLKFSYSRGGQKEDLKVIAHNTHKNSFTELPAVRKEWLPKSRTAFSASCIWSFSASLTSLP